MNYAFRYRLQSAPEASDDGSSACKHDIYAESREAGSSDAWVTVPGRHKTIVIPADELQTVMDMEHGTGTGPLAQAKNRAYKQLLSDNLNTQSEPITGWTATQLQVAMDANDASTAACAAADAYLTETLNLSYPISFNI